ncbi:C2 domain-containing protein At1g53590-like isoform X2 [Diospyros lotus]|uniref:C2 domain-containing protein At1g53590-like isoform X2 n=1 Tax=Diospyros lotus TaxID=55363 RepID=UPI002255CAA0|nr:C2 domain-containing protein At1g53590-like isoform X2 [Diospyros lotus]
MQKVVGAGGDFRFRFDSFGFSVNCDAARTRCNCLSKLCSLRHVWRIGWSSLFLLPIDQNPSESQRENEYFGLLIFDRRGEERRGEKSKEMGLLEASILHHLCIVLLLIWFLSSFFNCRHPLVFFLSLIYLYLVHERYVMRLRRKLRFQERRRSNQRRVLADSETVRWLNHVVEKIWPLCMEHIVSQKILVPIIPWFLHKFKPWTVREAILRHLYMGRSPPVFTDMRVLHQSNADDHLVLIGLKFLPHWPFLGRLRVCFVEPPYFQITVKPIFNRGVDVTELPGIAGWLDKLLALAFEQTLVEPNMLVIDMEKFISPHAENWFSVDEKEPVGYALVEIIEAADMKPSDLNGSANPYVKGKLGPYRFRTKTQRKTLAPKWREAFKVPICTWELPNVLTIEVRDKDHFIDDTLGDCSITISNLRGGQRHDMWLPLQNITTGRLHLAITVEVNKKGPDQPTDNESFSDNTDKNIAANETSDKGSISCGWSKEATKAADKFEPINIEGQQQTGIWAPHPGSEVPQTWEPRKGRRRILDAQIHGEGSDHRGRFKTLALGCNIDDSSSTDEAQEGSKGSPSNKVLRSLHNIGSIFQKNCRKEDISSSVEEPVSSPHPNLKPVNTEDTGVKLTIEEDKPSVEVPKSEGMGNPEGSDMESSHKTHVKDMAKSIFKHAGKSARGIRNALSHKWSKKYQGDSGSVLMEREISVQSESSSDEESSPSSFPTSRGIQVVSRDISSYGNDSYQPGELDDQDNQNNFKMNIRDPINQVNPRDDGAMGVYLSASSSENDDTLVVKEFPKPKISEENLENR